MLIEWFQDLSSIHQAFLATCFTWFVTALGSAMVFMFKSLNRKILDIMLGFAAGVMIAASFWSLLAPAIEMSQEVSKYPWIPAVIGFLLGGISLRIIDNFLSKFNTRYYCKGIEGMQNSWHRSILLITAITLHNIPEGLVIGVAFGAVKAGISSASLSGAVALAIGIGIQNFPEGAAVSFPLRREGLSRLKSFWFGQLSGMVEPIAGIIGAWAIIIMKPILPYALSFAAGAMMFVVIEELIPESQLGAHADIVTMGSMLGFSTMMLLDVALG